MCKDQILQLQNILPIYFARHNLSIATYIERGSNHVYKFLYHFHGRLLSDMYVYLTAVVQNMVEGIKNHKTKVIVVVI